MTEISGQPREGELELINKYTRKQLGQDEVYVFSVVLCDNDIDRDYERFSDEALEVLSKLYIGVTGITDHEPKTDNQSARIFSCSTEQVSGRLTADGRPYKRLCARAYMPRAGKNEELILALDSGIKKEVSIGCSVRKRTCSVCGKDISLCGHIKGKSYGGRLCIATLDEPTDAYEWSFVAVPAQKKAGVIKSYEEKNTKWLRREVSGVDIEKKLFAGGEQSFSEEEMRALIQKFRALEKKAAEGEFYRDRLIRDIKGLGALVLPELSSDTLAHITEELSVRQLSELKKSFEQRAEELLPIRPQLAAAGTRKNSNTDYKNI